jgi:hypothetical protein
MQIRLHRMFLSATSDILAEIVSFIKNRRCRMPLFRQFIRDNSASIRQKPPKRVLAKTTGKVYDLRQIYDEINCEYFGGMLDTTITWGAGSSRYAVRKRTLGSYSARTNVIRINQSLDSRRVPRYFISYIVYHEMLHAFIGIKERAGRRCIHTAEFRKREKLFSHYERAMEWERKSY